MGTLGSVTMRLAVFCLLLFLVALDGRPIPAPIFGFLNPVDPNPTLIKTNVNILPETTTTATTTTTSMTTTTTMSTTTTMTTTMPDMTSYTIYTPDPDGKGEYTSFLPEITPQYAYLTINPEDEAFSDSQVPENPLNTEKLRKKRKIHKKHRKLRKH